MIHTPVLKRRIRKIGAKIDIGCGHAKLPGFVGIDIRDFGQDILWDIREGIPLPNDSVQQVHSSHFIEHLTDVEAMVFWKDLLRVCAPGASVNIRCPHADSVEAHYSAHLSKWSERRIKGITLGIRGNPAADKFFTIEILEHVGMELSTVLTVHLKK